MKGSQVDTVILISVVLFFVLLVTGLTIYDIDTARNWWPGPVPAALAVNSGNANKTGDFYNIPITIEVYHSTTINKILIYPSSLSSKTIQNATVYINGTALLKPLKLHGGDNLEANVQVPVADLQSDSTYGVAVFFTPDAMVYSTGNVNS